MGLTPLTRCSWCQTQRVRHHFYRTTAKGRRDCHLEVVARISLHLRSRARKKAQQFFADPGSRPAKSRRKPPQCSCLTLLDAAPALRIALRPGMQADGDALILKRHSLPVLIPSCWRRTGRGKGAAYGHMCDWTIPLIELLTLDASRLRDKFPHRYLKWIGRCISRMALATRCIPVPRLDALQR